MNELAPWSPTEELLQLVEDSETVLPLAQAHAVTNRETYIWAEKDLTECSKKVKQLKAFKEQATRPVRDFLRDRDQYFLSAIKQFEAARDDLKRKLEAYDRRQQQVAAAAQAEANKAAKEMDLPAPVILPSTPTGKTKYRDNWTYEVYMWEEFVKAVVARGDFEALAPNDTVLKARAKEAGKAASKSEQAVLEVPSNTPGIRFVNNRIAVN